MTLQSALAPLVQTPGNVPFNAYRAFKSQVRAADEPFRFVDGELVEKFLDLDDDLAREVVKELAEGWDLEGVRGVVEGLRRLR